jgi:hypothetical protein
VGGVGAEAEKIRGGEGSGRKCEWRSQAQAPGGRRAALRTCLAPAAVPSRLDHSSATRKQRSVFAYLLLL